MCLKAVTRKQPEKTGMLSFHPKESTKKPPCSVRAVFSETWCKCFLVSTAKDLKLLTLEILNKHVENESHIIRVYWLAQVLKKHPIGYPFGTELCVRSCSVSPFLYTKTKMAITKIISSILEKIGVPKRGQ